MLLLFRPRGGSIVPVIVTSGSVTVQDALDGVRTILGGNEHFQDDEIMSVMQIRYIHLWETWNWSRRMRDFIITTVAQVPSTAADTVTVTNGSATITSIGTPFTAAMDGRQIHITALDTYFFITFISTSSVRLHDGEGNSALWPGDTASGQSWRVFQTLYALPADAAAVDSLAADDYRLDELDGGRPELDQLDPNRSSTDSRPIAWLYAGDTNGYVKRIEVWPVPSSARVLRGRYLRDAPTLTMTTALRIPTPVVIYATLADAFNGRYAKTGDESDQRQGLFYERKYDEVLRDYQALERERTSTYHTIGRARGHRLGGDWAVDHMLPGE